MKKITVSGGIPLRGTVAVSGSKNAALPILFATLVTGGISRLSGVPDIGDIRTTLRILECYGAHIRRDGGILTVDTRDVSYATPPDSLISSIRASTYLIGAGLARFGRADVRPFGGCAFSHRPIDIHLDACRDLGATVDGDRILCDRLHGGSICLRLRLLALPSTPCLCPSRRQGRALFTATRASRISTTSSAFSAPPARASPSPPMPYPSSPHPSAVLATISSAI